MANDEKIIQIIPAPANLHVVYDGDDEGGDYEDKVLCLALTNEGEILLMDTDDFGEVSECKKMVNFKGFIWKKD